MKRITYLFLALSLVSCASADKSKKNELSKVSIEKSLKKGLTKKSEVIKLLGSPEMVNSDSEGEEQWVYSKTASEWNDMGANVGLFGASFLSSALLGTSLDFGGSKGSSSTKTKTLEVYFDKKGILKSYSLSTSKI